MKDKWCSLRCQKLNDHERYIDNNKEANFTNVEHFKAEIRADCERQLSAEVEFRVRNELETDYYNKLAQIAEMKENERAELEKQYEEKLNQANHQGIR